MLFSHGPKKAFLVSDSCKATVRNGNGISTNMIEVAIENDYNNTCFCSFHAIWQLSWIVGNWKIDTIYIFVCTLSVNIKLIFTFCGTGQFLPVSKAGRNNFIFSMFVYCICLLTDTYTLLMPCYLITCYCLCY